MRSGRGRRAEPQSPSGAYNRRVTPFEALSEDYAIWWIDFLGEHTHVGGAESTRWLLGRSGLRDGDRMLDAGCFIGSAARMAAERFAIRAFATDVNTDFLQAGRAYPGGQDVRWVGAPNQRLPFAAGVFDSVWALDSPLAPRELSRVSAADATLCLCCEVPTDNRGGLESFLDEWAEHGWRLAAHKPLSLEATQTWRKAEAELVRRRPYYEGRYGKRGYLAQLDLMARMVLSYERGEQGHGLFVFSRGGR